MFKKESHPIVTILVISLGFLGIYFLKNWQWSLWVSLSVAIFGTISPYLARKIDWVWSQLSWVLSKIVPNILLTLIYFLLLLPIALLSRLFGKSDPLSIKNSTTSQLIDRKGTYGKESFEKPW